MNRKLNVVKRLCLIIAICISMGSAAQRDINHWQLSALGGGFYFDDKLSSDLEELDSPGYYTLGLRLQKRIGLDWQVGVTFLENRLRNNTDISERITDFHVSYHWDNGYLFDERSAVAPYHLLGAGFRTSGSSDELNIESSRGIVNFENGIKVRLADNWSTNIAFILNWTGRNETFDNIFSEGYSYGFAAGVSFHFGDVKTEYKAPVFNAGLATGTRYEASENLAMNYTYIVLNSGIANGISENPEITTDSLKAKRGLNIRNRAGENIVVTAGDSLFQLLGNERILDSLYVNRKEVLRLSRSSFNELKTPEFQRRKKASSPANDDKEEGFVNKQNRLIENQNKFIELLLSTSRVEGAERRDSLTGFENDSLSLMEAGLYESSVEREKFENELLMDTTIFRSNSVPDSLQNLNEVLFKKMEERLEMLESDNEKLREELEAQQKEETDEKSRNQYDRSDENTEELRRRNDLMEDQIQATEKLAEKSAEPTKVVVEDDRDDGKFNIQPGVMVPLGGNGSKKDNKELLENQRRMERRIDSLTYVISRMKNQNRSARPDITSTSTIRPSELDTVTRDSSQIDTLSTRLTTDTITAMNDSLKVDSLASLPNEDSSELEMEKDSTSISSEEMVKDSVEMEEAPAQMAEPEEASTDEKEMFMAYPVSLYFALNSATLSTEGEKKLKEVAVDLKDFPNKSVSLEGHTDKSGNAEYNRMLSEKRAQAVKSFLIENGVEESRISINPIGSEKARETYNKEARRVDVILD